MRKRHKNVTNLCKEEEEEAKEAAEIYEAEEADGKEADGVIYGRCETHEASQHYHF